MLQFVTVLSEKYSVVDEALMAIEGGCRWIHLSSESVGYDVERLKEVAVALIPHCRANEAFLVVEDDVDLVAELKVHGVFLRDSSRAAVAAVRERLGAEAVVGVMCGSFDDVALLKGLDIDYVCVAKPAGECEAASFYSDLKARMEEAELECHLVAYGDFEAEQMSSLITSGCSGVTASRLVVASENPAAAVKEMIDVLNEARRVGNGAMRMDF